MLGEADVKDESGNIIIQQGLKVRHKKSQFEYTVEDVIQEPGGEVTVVLRMPEEPRFEPPPAGVGAVISDRRIKEKMLYEVDPESLYFEPDPQEPPDSTGVEFMAVPQKEFEKEYEVK